MRTVKIDVVRVCVYFCLCTHRQTGIGVSSMFARMGGVLAPIINMLHTRSPSTPMLIFGTAPLLGAVLALALPETANRPLPDTVEDAENWDTRYCLPDLYLVLGQNNIKNNFLMHFWSLWVPMCQTRPIKHGQLIDSQWKLAVLRLALGFWFKTRPLFSHLTRDQQCLRSGCF